MPVISQRRWKRWCSRHGLDIVNASFSLDTCYYRSDWRSRPGTLLVYGDKVVHCSYRVWDTFWAIGEPSVRVELPFSDIHEARRKHLPFGLRLKQLFPDGFFELLMRDGESHHLILQRNSCAFAKALSGGGVSVVREEGTT